MCFFSALFTSVFAFISLAIAMFTPPISGPFAVHPIKYPFPDIISRFPGDYLWMYPAILLMIIFVVLMSCIYSFASKKNRIFSQVSLSLAIISASILLINYYIQVSFIQPSLINGEKEGIAFLTQYNPHGVFIALEEIGYLLMGLALLFLVPLFSYKNKLENSVRWVFLINFTFTLGSFIIISIIYGLKREYRFEVYSILFNWLTLIVSGIILSILFKRAEIIE